MKKYNLSAIMKRAWELVKTAGASMSEALRKAWQEAKAPSVITMNVIGKETFAINTKTGLVSGKTYNSRKFLKDNFNAKWDNDSRTWTVDTNKLMAEISKYPDYYKKYIVVEPPKSIRFTEMVNRWDGFYNHTVYMEGTYNYVFIG